MRYGGEREKILLLFVFFNVLQLGTLLQAGSLCVCARKRAGKWELKPGVVIDERWSRFRQHFGQSRAEKLEKLPMVCARRGWVPDVRDAVRARKCGGETRTFVSRVHHLQSLLAWLYEFIFCLNALSFFFQIFFLTRYLWAPSKIWIEIQLSQFYRYHHRL